MEERQEKGEEVEERQEEEEKQEKDRQEKEKVCVCVVTYPPLPMEGKATDLSFFSSARARQFFTVLSSRSSHLSEPQPGLLQWITNLAGRPKPSVRAAEVGKV